MPGSDAPSTAHRSRPTPPATCAISIADVIAYLSRHTVLRPGDLIATGTPARLAGPPGPERHLQPGDVVTVLDRGHRGADDDDRLISDDSRRQGSDEATHRVPRRDDVARSGGLPGAWRHRHRADRLHGAARAARPAPDRRPRADGGRPPHRAAGRGPRRAARQLRPVVPARRLHGPRPDPDPDLHGARRGPRRIARHGRFPPDRLPQRPLRQHVRHRLCLRERGGPAAQGRAGLPGQLLGRPVGRRNGGVLRLLDRPPREPGGDVGHPRDRPGRSWTWTTRTRRCRRSHR